MDAGCAIGSKATEKKIKLKLKLKYSVLLVRPLCMDSVLLDLSYE